jgi:hypothetical protein
MCLAEIAMSRGDKAAAGVEIARVSESRRCMLLHTLAIAVI